MEDGGIQALEWYFDNLATDKINEKPVIQQLVLNNTTPLTSNESLVAQVKKLTGEIKNLERENSHLKKGGQVSGQSTTLLHHCKKEGYHQPEACYKISKNKDKPPPPVGEARCDGVGR